VSCGIPGHDRPGTEMLTEVQRVDDPPLRWEVFGRCGFATDFAYRSDGDRSDRMRGGRSPVGPGARAAAAAAPDQPRMRPAIVRGSAASRSNSRSA
jgi:hypothetical protein